MHRAMRPANAEPSVEAGRPAVPYDPQRDQRQREILTRSGVARGARIVLWTGAVVLTLALVAAGLVFWSVRRAFPQHGGKSASRDCPRRSRSTATPGASRRSSPAPRPTCSRRRVRARAGPVLGDGLPPPRHGRTPVGAVRARPGGHRRLPAYVGLAPRRRAGVEPAGRRDPRTFRSTRPGSTPGSPTTVAPRRPGPRAWSTRCSDSTTAGTPSSRGSRGLAGLAQGDGLGPARQHGFRDRARAAARARAHPGAGGPALSRVPVRPQPPHHPRRRGREGRLRRDG